MAGLAFRHCLSKRQLVLYGTKLTEPGNTLLMSHLHHTTDPLLPHPPMLQRYPLKVVLHLANTEMRASASQLAAFRRFAEHGDPLADALVQEMRGQPQARHDFEQALAQGITSVPHAGPALRAFFEEAEAIPCWLDRNKLKLGAEAIQRTGLMGAYGALVDVSLMGGYLARRALKVLVRTGEIGNKAPRRIAETALWWISVTESDGMALFAEGYRNTLRVRLVHAWMRARMHAREDWDFADWDAPVNQPQMAGTQLLFSLVGLLGMRVMGFRFTDQEVDAVIHLWRYVGHLIGVHKDLLPANEADAWRLMWLLASTEFQPDADSRTLAQALSAALPPLHGIHSNGSAARAVIRYHSALTRLVLGKDNGDALGLESHPLYTLAVLATSATNFSLETLRQRIPGANRLSLAVGRFSRRLAIEKLAPPLQPDMTFSRG